MVFLRAGILRRRRFLLGVLIRRARCVGRVANDAAEQPVRESRQYAQSIALNDLRSGKIIINAVFHNVLTLLKLKNARKS
jgi:hypothetical protein